MSKVVKSMFGDFIEDEPADFAKFPYGSYVQVKKDMVDFFWFSGREKGRVVANGGRDLSIIVEFDEPLLVKNDDDSIWKKKDHGFNPSNLILLETPKPLPPEIYTPGLTEVWDD